MKLNEVAPEKAEVNTDLANAVKVFKNHQGAVKALAKSGALKFRGQELFDKDGGESPAMEKLTDKVKKFVKQRAEFDVEFPGAFRWSLKDGDGNLAPRDDRDDRDGLSEDFEYQAKAEDVEAVFAGYNDQGELVFGFDVWLDEDEFNAEWDKQFEETYGVSHDTDKGPHEKIFSMVWDAYSGRDNKGKDQHFWGIAAAVSPTDKSIELSDPVPGGFFKNKAKFGKLYDFF